LSSFVLKQGSSIVSGSGGFIEFGAASGSAVLGIQYDTITNTNTGAVDAVLSADVADKVTANNISAETLKITGTLTAKGTGTTVVQKKASMVLDIAGTLIAAVDGYEKTTINAVTFSGGVGATVAFSAVDAGIAVSASVVMVGGSGASLITAPSAALVLTGYGSLKTGPTAVSLAGVTINTTSGTGGLLAGNLTLTGSTLALTGKLNVGVTGASGSAATLAIDTGKVTLANASGIIELAVKDPSYASNVGTLTGAGSKTLTSVLAANTIDDAISAAGDDVTSIASGTSNDIYAAGMSGSATAGTASSILTVEAGGKVTIKGVVGGPTTLSTATKYYLGS
jgi:hypothetical protein